jgi:carboxylesterase type B
MFLHYFLLGTFRHHGTLVASFLQFGSPHRLDAQAQYVAAERSEVWVNMGYRLSAFGFLACDKPKLDGNYGFKDQWLALQWVRTNISSFGGKEVGRLTFFGN